VSDRQTHVYQGADGLTHLIGDKRNLRSPRDHPRSVWEPRFIP